MAPIDRFLMCLLLATVALWAVAIPAIRYQSAGPTLLQGEGLDPSQNWVQTGQPAEPGIEIDSGVPIGPAGRQHYRIGRTAALPIRTSTLLFEARVITDEPPPDRRALDVTDRSTLRSLVAVYFLDAADERIRHYLVLRLDGEQEEAVSRSFLPVPKGAHSVRLDLVGRGYGGHYRLVHARLDPLLSGRAYPALLGLTALAWLTLAALAARWLHRCVKWPGLLAVTASAAIIVWGVSLSERLDAATLNALLNNAVWDALGVAHPNGVLLFKIGHATAFALATLVALVGFGRGQHGVGMWRVVAFITLVACASESLQRHLPDRSGTLSDVAIDLSGALLALLLWQMRGRRSPGTSVESA